MGASYSRSGDSLSKQAEFTAGWTVRKLNATTHVIQEHDLFRELPLIYVKYLCVPTPHLLICDTGCGTAFRDTDLNGQWHNLRSFIEHHPVQTNSNKPLNPNGLLPYLVICSHCHYDHILGIPQFQRASKAQVIASSYCPSYL